MKKQKAWIDQLVADEIETAMKNSKYTKSLDQMVSEENSTEHLKKS